MFLKRLMWQWYEEIGLAFYGPTAKVINVGTSPGFNPNDRNIKGIKIQKKIVFQTHFSFKNIRLGISYLDLET